jgi:hypothetical protein
MPVIVKNLAAVADAPLTTHKWTFITVMLGAAANSHIPFVVAHRWTGDTYSTTVYDAAAHRLYRATHPRGMRGFLKAIASERRNVKLLKSDEVLCLRVVDGREADRAGWTS